MPQSYDLVLRHCQLLYPAQVTEAEAVDIAIQAGKIVAIAPQLSGTAQLELDVQGQLVSPPFVESHIHLDSALTAGEPRWNQSGSLFEGIEIWRDRKQSLTLEDVKIGLPSGPVLALVAQAKNVATSPV